MPETQMFRLGADVRCTDGDCGQIKSVVISPGEDAVTHLVIEPAGQQGLGKLVPLSLVDTAPASAGGDEVRLRCTVAEYGQLDAAEATYFFQGEQDYQAFGNEQVVSWPIYAPPGSMSVPGSLGMPGPMGMPGMPGDDPPGDVAQVVTEDTVPDLLPGEDEVSSGEQVHATDGDIGHIRGIAVDPGTGRVTAVLLRERHLLSHRTVLIPRSAVAEVGTDGFHLTITKHEVQELPRADTD